jgi:hypothetical protein
MVTWGKVNADQFGVPAPALTLYFERGSASLTGVITFKPARQTPDNTYQVLCANSIKFAGMDHSSLWNGE